MPLRFYEHKNGVHGCFSNFSAHPFTLDGLLWPTSEHYFQAQKFPGTDWAEQIRKAPNPMKAKTMGGSRKHPLRPDWERVKEDVMRRALAAKFAQHADARAVLLSTGDDTLIEAAPRDYYWGCGTRGTGKNRLGLLLMELRTNLRTQQASESGHSGR
jgi:ribA/ribD-fused uncharacterized protein